MNNRHYIELNGHPCWYPLSSTLSTLKGMGKDVLSTFAYSCVKKCIAPQFACAIYAIRKSSDYVFGIWQRKVLNMKNLSQTKFIGGKILCQTCIRACIRQEINRKFLSTIPNVHTNCQLKTLIKNMMTSSNGNIFRVTGHLCGGFTGPRWIPRTKASDAEL